MLIVDAQIHLWEKGTPSAHHRQELAGDRLGRLAGDLLRDDAPHEQRERVVAVGGERAGADATRAAYFGPEFGSIETPVCVRSAVGTQWRTGPLLIEEFDSTTVVPPDGRARLGNWDTIEIELE